MIWAYGLVDGNEFVAWEALMTMAAGVVEEDLALIRGRCWSEDERCRGQQW